MAQRIKGTDRSERLLGDVGVDYIWGNGGNDRIDGFSKKDFLYGGDGSDLILGGDDNDKLYGGNGSDRLYGGYGDDRIFADDANGTQANDRIYGGAENDIIVAGGGKNYIDGESETDLAAYHLSTRAAVIDLESSISAGGDIKGFAKAGNYATDTLLNIECVIGTIYADRIQGSSSDNVFGWTKNTGMLTEYFLLDVAKGLDGGMGNDRLFGHDGDDVLIGGAGADLLNGGNETFAGDSASYWGSKKGVTVNLNTNRGTAGDAKGDVLVGIENIYGSAKADKITGSAGNNTLYGQSGDDRIADGEGDDLVVAGTGNDTVNAGVDGFDSYDGGTGFDILNLAALGSGGEGVIVITDVDGYTDPLRPWISATGGTVTNGTNDDFIRAFEKIIGTVWNDEFYGNINDNSFAGGDGDDLFKGSKGADIYAGGNGSDTFIFEAAHIGPKSGTTNIDTILDYQAGDFLDFADLVLAGKIIGDPYSEFSTKVITSGTMLYLSDGNTDPDVVLFSKNYTITVDDLIADGAFIF